MLESMIDQLCRATQIHGRAASLFCGIEFPTASRFLLVTQILLFIHVYRTEIPNANVLFHKYDNSAIFSYKRLFINNTGQARIYHTIYMITRALQFLCYGLSYCFLDYQQTVAMLGKKKVQCLLSIASKPSPIFDFRGFMH